MTESAGKCMRLGKVSVLVYNLGVKLFFGDKERERERAWREKESQFIEKRSSGKKKKKNTNVSHL